MSYPSSSTSPDENILVREFSQPLYQARGWLKFLGILNIIGGVAQALSIVGILVAWIPIWMGVLLYQAGSNLDSAGQFGDKFSFLRSLGSLKTYFVLQGVLTLILLVISFLSICLAIILPLLGISLFPWGDALNSY